MTKNWESTFASWAQGPSATEKERAENAERQIRKAIQTSDKLKNRNIKEVSDLMTFLNGAIGEILKSKEWKEDLAVFNLTVDIGVVE